MEKMPTHPLICLLLISCFFAPACHKGMPKGGNSQPTTILTDHDPYFVETISTTSPFGPNSITRNTLQDSKGDIWLATWEGILRYDGQSFTNFTNKNGLRRFHAFAVLEDSKGNRWFGTIGAGVYRYDGGTFTNFTTNDGLANDRVTDIYEDKKGHIWFSTEGGASRFDGKVFRNFTTEDGLANNDVNSIIEDKNGLFWIGTRGEACTFDGEKFSLFTKEDGTPFTNVRCIIEDRLGRVWLGGNDGLWRFDQGALTNFSTSFTGYIFEDSKGNIWTSSESADDRTVWTLSRYDKKNLPFEEGSPTVIKAEEGMYFGIMEDNEGGIWLGTLNGVYRYDGESFENFKE